MKTLNDMVVSGEITAEQAALILELQCDIEMNRNRRDRNALLACVFAAFVVIMATVQVMR